MVGALTECSDYEVARNYWKVTKHRMKKESLRDNMSTTELVQAMLEASALIADDETEK